MDKRWFEQYQKGVPYEIDPNQYSSLVEVFKESCHKHAKQVAYTNLGCDITYAELEKLCRNFAAYLQQLNLEQGSRVAIMLPNVLQYPVAFFGTLLAGHIVVNTNPLYTTDELIHQMNDSGAEVILVLANFAKTVEKALPSMTKIKHIIVTEVADLFPTVKRVIINAVVKYVKKLVPAYNISHAVAFNYTLLEGQQAPLHHVTLNHENIALLQYTGGTTGVAKGAILTHGNLVSNLLQAFAWITPLMHGDEVVVTAIPLYHIFSLTANCLTFMKVGAKNILITNPRDVNHFIKEIKHCGFTTITGVNTLFNMLLNNPNFKKVDFSRLKLSLAGGMALQKSVALKWKEITKTRVLEAYGLTETSPAAMMNPLSLNIDYNGSVGLPISSTDVIILDDDEKEVPIGERGEICIKGPQVTPGYWHRPDETALAFTKNGYFKSGDIGRMDEEGFIYIVDRKKDMLLVSGFNVYPNEIEQVISMHPGVLEVGVIGVPDTESGERVKACIVKKDPDLTEDEVIAYSREHLTAYKVPKIVEFFDELPKTNVGKILRRALKK